MLFLLLRLLLLMVSILGCRLRLIMARLFFLVHKLGDVMFRLMKILFALMIQLLPLLILVTVIIRERTLKNITLRSSVLHSISILWTLMVISPPLGGGRPQIYLIIWGRLTPHYVSG